MKDPVKQALGAAKRLDATTINKEIAAHVGELQYQLDTHKNRIRELEERLSKHEPVTRTVDVRPV